MNRRALVMGGMAGLTVTGAATARPASIDEQGFVTAGGIEQWIAIRGRDRSARAILFLHGGPAEAQSPLRDSFGPLEERFVLAHWDQRGAGLTHRRSPAASAAVTTEQLVDDGIAIARHVISRLGRQRIVLAGHSWGTILGSLMVRREPRLFSAFVATGLEVNWPATVAAKYRYTLAAARAAGNAAAVAELESGGPPSPTSFEAQRPMGRWFSQFMPASDAEYLAYQRRRYAAMDPAAAASLRAGGAASIPRLIPTIMSFDARAAGPRFPAPFHLIQGREDWFTPTAEAMAYVRELETPHSATVIDGGHFAFASNPSVFASTLAARLV